MLQETVDPHPDTLEDAESFAVKVQEFQIPAPSLVGSDVFQLTILPPFDP